MFIEKGHGMFSKTLFCFLTMLLQVVPFVQANSLTIKNWQDDDKPTASKTTKSNIYIEKANAAQNIANTPAESSAAKCASKTVRIEWQPKWVYSGVGGVNIPRAALSSDQSLLAIIENYENSNGEFSSMIILLNTYNNRAVRVIDLPRRKANRLIFLPGMEKLAVQDADQRLVDLLSSLVD